MEPAHPTTVDACVAGLGRLLEMPHKKDPLRSRAVVAQRRQDLKPLRHAQELANFLGEPMQMLAAAIIDSYRNGDDWVSGGFKAHSLLGYDIVQNRVVDYGNFQYTSGLAVLARHNPMIATALEEASQWLPTLQLDCTDTDASLERKGDVVEIMFALARGHDEWHIRGLYSAMEWRIFFGKVCAFFNAIDILKAHTIGGRTKRTSDIRARALTPDLRDAMYSSQTFARVVDGLLETDAIPL